MNNPKQRHNFLTLLAWLLSGACLQNAIIAHPTIDGYICFPNGDMVTAFSVSITDSATGEHYNIETSSNHWVVLDTTSTGIGNRDVKREFKMAHVFTNAAKKLCYAPVYLPSNGRLRISIHNILGQTIDKTSQSLTSGNYAIRVNTAGFATGVYILAVQFKGQQHSQRLLVFGQGNNYSSGKVIEDIIPGGKFSKSAPEKTDNNSNYETNSVGKANTQTTLDVRIQSTANPAEFEDIQFYIPKTDTTVHSVGKEPISFAGNTFTTNEDGTLYIPKNDIAQGNYGLDSLIVTPGHAELYVTSNGDTVIVNAGKDVNSTDYGLLPLNVRAVAPHGTVKESQVNTEFREQSDLANWKLTDVVNMKGITTPTTFTLTNGTNSYEFATADSLLNAQVEPGTYTLMVNNDSMHTPFIIKTADGQIARSMPSDVEASLNLNQDLEGKVYMINKSFNDTTTFNKIWDRASPKGVDLWRPPADGSDPAGTTTLDTMGFGDGIPTGPYTENIYVYLGEDAEHQLEAPFNGLSPNLRQMSDEVKEKVIEYLVSERVNSLRNAGLEGDERYQINVYFGRNPPLRQIQKSNHQFIRSKKGWRTVLPYNGNFHAEEVDDSNNRTVSTLSFLDMRETPIFEGELNGNYRAELTQGYGPRNDDDVNTNSPSFYGTKAGNKTIQPYDIQAQRISNIFGEGFSFKE